MSHARIVSLGFLLTALFFAVLPLASGLMASRRPFDDALHDTYYIVQPWPALLSLPAASALFAAIYWMGTRFGLGYGPRLLWLHLILWTAGAAMLYAPQFVVPLMSFPDFDDPAGDFARLHTLSTAGYCVTLISLAVFAICIGQAILQRIRRAKPL